MKLSVLMDDAACSNEFVCEHGLSFFLETADGSLLFDMGTTDLFLKNAETLGLSLPSVRWGVLSHGHVDHGGGIPTFLRVNDHAPIYVSAKALEGHYTTRQSGEVQDIGLPSALEGEPRIHALAGDAFLSPSLFLFSSVSGQAFQSRSNAAHLVRTPSGDVSDCFAHEQSLLITEGSKSVLIAGCAHRGIVNILGRAMELAGKPLDAVVSGFHLSNPRDGGSEANDIVDGVADYLSRFSTQYYTCHCTGAPAFARLKLRLGEQLHQISSGSQLLI